MTDGKHDSSRLGQVLDGCGYRSISHLTSVVLTYSAAQESSIKGSHDLERRLLHLVTEVGELIEAYRLGPDRPSSQVPGMRHVAEELADIFALILLIAEYLDVDLAPVLHQKLDFCLHERPSLHGKEW